MARPYLFVLLLSLVLAVCNTARRKPEQLVCATDFYAKAMTTVGNLSRKGRGQAPRRCVTEKTLAGWP